MGNFCSGDNRIGRFGFTRGSDADDIVKGKNFRGLNVVITGTSSGIGLETARVFYKNGADVFCFCRNEKKMKEANEEIVRMVAEERGKDEDEDEKKKTHIEPGTLHEIICDLSNQESVHGSVENFKDRFPDVKIDRLFCNAGIMMWPKGFTVDGFERQIGTNHYGHFTLTMLLLPMMNEPSRIIITSSEAHRMFKPELVFEDLHFYERKYDEKQSYGHSKIANVYFTRELNRLLRASKRETIVVNCLHPGVIPTNLAGHLGWANNSVIYLGMKVYFSILGDPMKTLPQGASTQVLLGVSDDPLIKDEGGRYFCDNDCEKEPMEVSQDMAIANRLFKQSIKDTGVRYPFVCEDLKEDINDVSKVKDSRPENWKEIVEKEQKKEEDEGEEVEGEGEDDDDDDDVKELPPVEDDEEEDESFDVDDE